MCLVPLASPSSHAVRDGKRLAFEVFGSGLSDLAVVQAAFPIDLMWNLRNSPR